MPKKKFSKFQNKPNIRGQQILSILDVVRTRELNFKELYHAITLSPPYMNEETALNLLEAMVESKKLININDIVCLPDPK